MSSVRYAFIFTLLIGVGPLLLAGPVAAQRPEQSVVYLGNGDGTFSTADADLTGVKFSSSSIADVNNDGNPDLLITGQPARGLPLATLYLGDGQGEFNAATAGLRGVSGGASSIAAVNGDDNPDLLIVGYDGSFSGGSAKLYLGNGDGTFQEADRPGVQYGSSASGGDVNNDDNPDFLITGSDPSGARSATLYLGDGQGGFSEANAGLTGVSNGSSSIGDVNGDGNPDFLITGNAGASSVPHRDLKTMLYLGKGDGRFSTAGAGLAGVAWSSSSMDDVNGDGNLDLLITGEDSSDTPTATLYLGSEDGTFSRAEADLTGVSSGSTAMGDVNNDGHLDLVVTGKDANDNRTATVYLGDGSGGFSAAEADLTGVSGGSTSIADLDGDGNLDLLITGSSGPRRVFSEHNAAGTINPSHVDSLFDNWKAAGFQPRSSLDLPPNLPAHPDRSSCSESSAPVPKDESSNCFEEEVDDLDSEENPNDPDSLLFEKYADHFGDRHIGTPAEAGLYLLIKGRSPDYVRADSRGTFTVLDERERGECPVIEQVYLIRVFSDGRTAYLGSGRRREAGCI